MTDPHEAPILHDAPRTSVPERIVPGTPNWDQGYPDHIQRYRFVARRTPWGSRVLDAGCGVGYGAAFLVDSGASMVVAVDIASEALLVARQYFHREQIHWVQDDCHTLKAVTQFAPFDVVCNLENLEHLRQPDLFLRRASELIKPDGALITSTPNRLLENRENNLPPDAPPRNPYHSREYSREELEALLGRYFCSVTLWHQCEPATERLRRSLRPALKAIWSNPAMRLGRHLQVMLGRTVPRSLDDVFPQYSGDFEILENDPGPYVTKVFIAVCSRPRRPSAAVHQL